MRIITKAVLAVSMAVMCAGTAHAQEKGTDQKPYRYEGSVNISFSHMIRPGIFTLHGVRMDEGRWFLGGVLAADTGYPYGISAHIGSRPRWFFVNRDKFEMYLGLGAGYAFGREKWKLKVSADEETTATNYLHGARLTPELGLGFKLRNGDAIDIGLLCDVDFRFHGVSYFDSTIAKPGISIGYRF